MADSVCYVTGADYCRYWERDRLVVIATGGYLGPERRVVAQDRRSGKDRRFDAVRGRRFRLADRRRRVEA